MGKKRTEIIRTERMDELAEIIGKKEYIQKYSYGFTLLEMAIGQFDKECEKNLGRSLIDTVQCRIKSARSIAEKLEKKGHEISYANAVRYLSDLAGVRVVCAFRDDVYAVDHFLRHRPSISVVKRKDYIKHPKDSGYQSIHLIAEMDYPLGSQEEKVRIEVQIRTVAMNYWAKLDHQLCYKTEGKTDMDIAGIRQELRSYAEEIAQIDERMLALRKRIEAI